jgi:hypothetical protein
MFLSRRIDPTTVRSQPSPTVQVVQHRRFLPLGQRVKVALGLFLCGSFVPATFLQRLQATGWSTLRVNGQQKS